MRFDPTLYFIGDLDHLKDPKDTVAKALRGGVTLLQLRAKLLSDTEFLALAKALHPIAHSFSVPMLINDRVVIALKGHADGVHLGQTDAPVRDARITLGPDAIVGVSAHTTEEALTGARDGADYVGAGTVFQTQSKNNIRGIIGTKGLREICLSVTIPVVGIGGIHAGNAFEVYRAGAAGIAVLSAIGNSEDPEMESKKLKEIARQVKDRDRSV